MSATPTRQSFCKENSQITDRDNAALYAKKRPPMNKDNLKTVKLYKLFSLLRNTLEN